MADDARTCPSCGARVPAGADACDLCGTSVDDTTEAAPAETAEAPPTDDTPAEAEADSSEVVSEAELADAVYCNECGWENPGEANYCSQCGSALQDLTAADSSSTEPASAGTRAVTADLPGGGDASVSDADKEPDVEDEQAEMGQQIMWVVGGALVLVLGLFFATQWSQQYEWESSEGSTAGPAVAQQPSDAREEGASAPAGPSGGASGPQSPQTAAAQGPKALSTLVDELGGTVEGSVADEIDSLRAAVDEAEGNQRRQLQSQLVNLYLGAGAPGQAAQIQSRLADQTGQVEDRRRAANLLYKWMRQVEQQGDRAKVSDVARHVAEAFAAVVEQRPEDLDARTRMGEAYLLTNSPMEGIQAINQVLEDDSTFVPARFQKGLALLQINRLDQAIAQFERVMEYASQDDPFYQQAKRAIEVIREEAGSSEQGSSTGA